MAASHIYQTIILDKTKVWIPLLTPISTIYTHWIFQYVWLHLSRQEIYSPDTFHFSILKDRNYFQKNVCLHVYQYLFCSYIHFNYVLIYNITMGVWYCYVLIVCTQTTLTFAFFKWIILMFMPQLVVIILHRRLSIW